MLAVDPTYGYDLDALLIVGSPDPPDDFADFWRTRYDAARAVRVDPARSGGVASGDVVEFDVEFGSIGGIRLGGWLTVPADGVVERGLISVSGYGGRDGPDAESPVDRAATLHLGGRGLPTRGLIAGIPDTAAFHVLHGISSRDTYLHGDCAADVWCAVTALQELAPECDRIDYLGSSFGGGIGALAAPWDPRIATVCLVVPSFGNHPLRLTLPCEGSGESVRRYAGTHPEVVDVLRYFDAATAARYLAKPTHISAALADPAVPPPGQFAVYNAAPGPKDLFVLTAGHMDYPDAAGESAAMVAAQGSFLSR